MVVVDSGSTDGTAAVAREGGAEVVDFRWDGRFPKKRNWALRNLRFETPWVLFLDADEVVTGEWVAEAAAKLEGTRHAGFWIVHGNRFLGRRLRHGDRIRKLALFRVGAGEYERIDEEQWSGLDMEIHEHPVLEGTTGEIVTPVEHDDFKGLHAWIAKHNEYASWEARRWRRLMTGGPGGGRDEAAWARLTDRQRRKYGAVHRWWFAPAYFLGSYVARGGFRDGRPGFVLAALKAQYFWHIRLKIGEARAR